MVRSLMCEHGVWPARRPDAKLLDLSVPAPVPLHANSASANAKPRLACRLIFCVLTCDTNHPGRRLRGPIVPGSVYITHAPALVRLSDRPSHRSPSHRPDTKRYILRRLLLMRLSCVFTLSTVRGLFPSRTEGSSIFQCRHRRLDTPTAALVTAPVEVHQSNVA